MVDNLEHILQSAFIFHSIPFYVEFYTSFLHIPELFRCIDPLASFRLLHLLDLSGFPDAVRGFLES